MTRYEVIKAKSFDEMVLFIDSMLNGSVCPVCDSKYCDKCNGGEPTVEQCCGTTDDDCFAALKKWLREEIE